MEETNKQEVKRSKFSGAELLRYMIAGIAAVVCIYFFQSWQARLVIVIAFWGFIALIASSFNRKTIAVPTEEIQVVTVAGSQSPFDKVYVHAPNAEVAPAPKPK